MRSSDTCSAVGKHWRDVSWIVTLVPFCPSLLWGWAGSITPWHTLVLLEGLVNAFLA